MKSLIFICILVGLLIYSSLSTRCVCKCCDTDGCNPSTAQPQSFDVGRFCNELTCNRLACSIQFENCPIPTSAGNVESACSESNMASVSTPILLTIVGAIVIGIIMK